MRQRTEDGRLCQVRFTRRAFFSALPASLWTIGFAACGVQQGKHLEQMHKLYEYQAQLIRLEGLALNLKFSIEASCDVDMMRGLTELTLSYADRVATLSETVDEYIRETVPEGQIDQYPIEMWEAAEVLVQAYSTEAKNRPSNEELHGQIDQILHHISALKKVVQEELDRLRDQ